MGAPAYSGGAPAGNKVMIGVGAGIVVVLLVVVAFLTVARKPTNIAAPAGFSKVTAPDNTFICMGPADPAWQNENAGIPGSQNGYEQWADGPAKIDIEDSFGASVMSDIRKIPDPNNPGSFLNPAEGQHEMSKDAAAAKYGDYTETDFKDMPSAYGTACYSEFDADGGFMVGKVHGIRATLMGSERSISVICVCPAANFDTLKPAFWQVINSIARGPEEQ
jgi:hypothetical protein